MEISDALSILGEAKIIFHNLGIIFFLRQGTCLGVIREKRLITWDDDIDLCSIIGLHGLNEEQVNIAILEFNKSGYSTQLE